MDHFNFTQIKMLQISLLFTITAKLFYLAQHDAQRRSTHYSLPPPVSPDQDEFLFEKGDLNLWAEPLQWARLLHTHLASLASAVGAGGIAPAELHRLSEMAQKQARSSERALGALPALPEFSANLEHARLSVQRERAALALRVLGKLQKDSLSS